MNISEYRAKLLLSKKGFMCPNNILIEKKDLYHNQIIQNKITNFLKKHQKVVVKAQVPSTGRLKKGLIKISSNANEVFEFMNYIFSSSSAEVVNKVLIEQFLLISHELFISISFDGHKQKIKILFSKTGGINVEDNINSSIQKLYLDPSELISPYIIREFLIAAKVNQIELVSLSNEIFKLYNFFINYDCILLEVNPLAYIDKGKYAIIDCKCTIDDNARNRQVELFQNENSEYYSKEEINARLIDSLDYKGVAGKSYIDLDGDIAILASGGGASLVLMDALYKEKIKPANYVEYSGNPSVEKVEKISELVLNKNNLRGCLIVGGIANFTDIYETLNAIINVIIKLKPKYPIVIRRSGPRQEEAKELVSKTAQKYNLNMTMFTEEMSIDEVVKYFKTLLQKK